MGWPDKKMLDNQDKKLLSDNKDLRFLNDDKIPLTKGEIIDVLKMLEAIKRKLHAHLK